MDGEEKPKPIDNDGYFDQTPTKNNISSTTDLSAKLRRETVLALESMGIPIQNYHHEVAPGQHEIVLRHTNALTMADSIISYKSLAKQIAMSQGVYATFMPKPFNHLDGSGMHTHISLFKGNQNVFYNPKDPFYLSKEARQFMAGLYRHSSEITAITNQWVNSYKRLVPSYEAPTYITWAEVNRSDLIRIPSYKPGRESSRRIEYRAPDPACNPYLAFSVMLCAGLEGIEKEYELPESMDKSAHDMTKAELKELGIESLPGNLWEAIQVTEKSDLVKEALGESVFHSFIENKKIEWDRYNGQISQYELDRYLPTL